MYILMLFRGSVGIYIVSYYLYIYISSRIYHRHFYHDHAAQSTFYLNLIIYYNRIENYLHQ